MAYLTPTEFVTKMVDAGESKIFMSTRDTLIRAYMAGAILALAAAFLQLYREEGWYLERTVHYVQRVGLDRVKQAVVEDLEKRRALHARLLYALKDYEDPWLAAVEKPLVRREFEPLEV